MIALTFDTDWVNEELLIDLVKILKENQLKATFFVTGRYDLLKDPLFEVNPHINFNSNYHLYKKEFLKIKKFARRACAVRNHSLYFHERLRPVLLELNVKYSSNTLLPLVNNVRPYYLGRKILEIPIYFLDYWYLETFGPKAKFDLKNLRCHQPGLKVFDFHPIHLALNTPSLKYYEKHKHLYHQPANIKKARFEGQGIGTLFEKFIKYLVKNKVKTYQLKEIYRQYK